MHLLISSMETTRRGNGLINGRTGWAGWPGEGNANEGAPRGLAGLGSASAGGAAWPSEDSVNIVSRGDI
jgi:hypothetical protein